MKLGRRLVMFPIPLQGHSPPMLQLATFLQSKGFSITVIHTLFNSPDPTNFPQLTFRFIDDGLSNDTALLPGQYSVVPNLLATCSEPFRDCLSQLLSSEQETAVSCLIVDPLWLFVASHKFELPRIVFFTGSLSAFHVYHSFPLIRQKGYLSLRETNSDKLVEDLPPFKVDDLPAERYHEFLEGVVKETKTSQGIIFNTFNELESASLAIMQQSLHMSIFTVGPVFKFSLTNASSLWTEDQSSMSWLNTQTPKSVLYVSFGSLAAINEAEFHEIAWGLANSMQPFLWVVRPDLIRGLETSNLLSMGYMEGVRERGLIVKWAPQLEVLAHPSIGGFWTHCGWNSTLESISQGVPMICKPFFVDQSLNARNVSDNWRVGLQLEKGIIREEIAKVIKILMVEKEGEEMRNRAAMLKEKATSCLLEGGSSYESLEHLTSYLLSL